jgi:hypothetical protein
MPAKETATVRVEAPIHPPLLGLDFWSTDAYIVELDGNSILLPAFHDAALTPGKHTVTVDVWKGPTGLFGVAPLLGKCRGQLPIDAEAGHAYIIKFKRDERAESLESIDSPTGVVLIRVPCVPRKNPE